MYSVVALGKPDAAVTFGDLADTYVATVLRTGSEYHVTDDVFEKYRDETIEGMTRTLNLLEGNVLAVV